MHGDFNIITGEILKNARKNKKITLSEAAKICNKSIGWLSDIESGRNRIYFDDMKKLCILYDITLDAVANQIDKKGK